MVSGNSSESVANDYWRTFRWIFWSGGPIALILFSGNYLSTMDTSDMMTATDAMRVLTASMACVGSHFSVGIHMNNTKVLFREIQAIVDQGEYFEFGRIQSFQIEYSSANDAVSAEAVRGR